MAEFDNNVNENNSSANESEFTPADEGGFYTKSKEDIIQDDITAEKTVETSFGDAENPDSEENPENYSYANTNTNTDYGHAANYGYGGFSRVFERSEKPKKEKKKYGIGAVILSAFLAAVIAVAATFSALIALNVKLPFVTSDDNGNTAGGTTNNVSINIDEQSDSAVAAVFEKIAPSVVGIRTTTSVMSFFGGISNSSGEGSGVVYSADGYIITNYHVISGAVENSNSSKIEVFTDNADSQGVPATVVGYNIPADIAVIKINKGGLTPVEFADSDKLKQGQYVISVGNPGGLEFMDSVTYGVISGLDRVVSTDTDVKLIQTDAAINPGNSGGALANTSGELVGINSSKIVSEQIEGMGFAIPSNLVKQICKKIIDREGDPEPYLGITISEKYTPSVLEYYGYPVGAVVLSVADSSPAANAGIQKGDIITKYDKKKISEYSKLEEYTNQSKPGDKVILDVYRAGRTYEVTVTVGANSSVS